MPMPATTLLLMLMLLLMLLFTPLLHYSITPSSYAESGR